MSVGLIILCRHYQPGGVFVQAMDYTRSEFTGYTGKRTPAMVEKGIHEGSASCAGSWMDHKPRMLVDNYQMAVFVDDVQRNAGGNQIDGFRIRDVNCYYLAVFKPG